LQKVQQTGRHSKETEINRFLLWDTTDKEGEATCWPNEKHVFSDENLSKLCAEGAIQNLLNMLHFLPQDMNIFWELAISDLITLMKSLNESFFPKAVLTPSLGIDSIQKCLWILRKKFKFQTTQKINDKHFSLFEAIIESAFRNKFPMLILFSGNWGS
jgi:hypothetical protein